MMRPRRAMLFAKSNKGKRIIKEHGDEWIIRGDSIAPKMALWAGERVLSITPKGEDFLFGNGRRIKAFGDVDFDLVVQE